MLGNSQIKRTELGASTPPSQPECSRLRRRSCFSQVRKGTNNSGRWEVSDAVCWRQCQERCGMGQVNRGCSCRVRNRTCGLKTLVKRIKCLARNGLEFGITFGNRVKPMIALSCPLYRSLCSLLMSRVQLHFQHFTSFYLGKSLIPSYQWTPLGPASLEVHVSWHKSGLCLFLFNFLSPKTYGA